MTFRELASFEIVHGDRAWPWVAFAGDLVAFASSTTTIATRRIVGDAVEAGPSFAVPADLQLATFSVSEAAVVVAGDVDSKTVIAILDSIGEQARVEVDSVAAIAFDRTGRRIWISSETATQTVITLVDATSLATLGVLRSAALPRPSLHELHVHAVDDAVLLLAACGEEGTFARVAGFADNAIAEVPSALDGGAVAAGFVGFSADGARVHLVEADELRTHAWPTLHELSSVPLADEFISSFSGAVLGNDIFVDGEDADSQEDLVMVFDRAAIHGIIEPGSAPPGMWAGRLGSRAIVTIQPAADPARASVLLQTSAGARITS